MGKKPVKRKMFLAIAALSFLFRNWTVRKKLHMGFFSLIAVLALNVVLMAYEISRLKQHQLKLSYLIYLDVIGIVTGCLFIWIISQSVLRPMKRIIEQLESQSSLKNLNLHSNDEIGQLARAVNHIKKNNTSLDGTIDEKNLLLETILSHSFEGIFIFDQTGKLSSYSQGFKKMMGYSKHDQKPSKLTDILKDLDVSLVLTHLSKVDLEHHFYEQNVQINTKSSKNYQAQCSICKVQGPKHEMYIGILKRISSRKRLKNFFSKAFKVNFK